MIGKEEVMLLSATRNQEYKKTKTIIQKKIQKKRRQNNQKKYKNKIIQIKPKRIKKQSNIRKLNNHLLILNDLKRCI